MEDLEVLKQEDHRVLSEYDSLAEMMSTKGWSILEKILKEEFQKQVKQLQTVPMLPENLSILTLAQAQVKGIQYIFDVLDEYKRQREAILEQE